MQVIVFMNSALIKLLLWYIHKLPYDCMILFGEGLIVVLRVILPPILLIYQFASDWSNKPKYISEILSKFAPLSKLVVFLRTCHCFNDSENNLSLFSYSLLYDKAFECVIYVSNNF